MKNLRAVKAVPKSEKTEKDGSLLNQLNMLCEVDHPDIIKLYEIFEDKERIYYVTEYLMN